MKRPDQVDAGVSGRGITGRRFTGLLAPFANLSRDKLDTLLLIATCALIMAPHGAHLPGWIVQVAVALLFWRGWITFRGERLPPRWLLLPACLLVMGGVLLSFDTMIGRDTGVAMLVLLVAFKLLEMHEKRDAFVVVFLSFFLILMNFFYSQSILTTILMGLAVVLVLTVQISFQYSRQAPPLAQRLRLAGSIVGLALPLMVVLFLLFPRFSGPFWGSPGAGGRSATGLSQTMSPGNITHLAQSPEIAFRVAFNGAVPAPAMLYWRGPVLGHFDGRTWSPLPGRQQSVRPVVTRLNNKLTRYQVTLEPTGQQSLFTLEMPAALPQMDRQAVLLMSDMQLLTRAPVTQRLRYDAASYLDFQYTATETQLSLRDWVQLPPGFNPRTHELAAQLAASSSDPVALVGQVLKMFRDQNFRYTLDPPPLGQNPVDDFLFNTRAGFCEHFASAFVVLLRAMDIPSRVVTGYQGGELNQVDNFLSVRQSDAHAWAEVWLPGRGWVRIDPTAAVAPERIDSSARSAGPRAILGGLVSLPANSVLTSAFLRLRQDWEALNNRWNQWVLDYSAKRQQNLLEALGFHDTSWRMLAKLLAAAFAVVLAGLALLLARQRQARDPLQAVYDRFAALLARHGKQRAAHEGPRGWRERLLAEGDARPEQLRAWAEFLQLYETLRYAPPPAGRAHALQRLKSLLTLCR